MNRRRRGIRYRSIAQIAGVPLIDIALGGDFQRGERRGYARGIIAIGDIASGWLALGGVARGMVAFGGLSLGVIAFGGVTAGIVSIGGLGLGLLALAGAALAGRCKRGSFRGFLAIVRFF